MSVSRSVTHDADFTDVSLASKDTYQLKTLLLWLWQEKIPITMMTMMTLYDHDDNDDNDDHDIP